jgi:hypothetical protein
VQERGDPGRDEPEQPADACQHAAEGTSELAAEANAACARRLRKDRTTLNPNGKDRSTMVSTTKEKAAAAAANARPYVEQAFRDEELRDNIRNAYTSARAVFDELTARRKVTDAASRLAADKDIHNEIRTAIEELRNASRRVKDVQPAEPEPARSAKSSLILLFGIVVGLLLNPITGPALRRMIARKLFGDSDDFVYQGNGSKTSTAA